MNEKLKRFLPASVLAASTTLLPALASAAVDISDVTTAKTDVGTVGAAVFSVVVILAVFVWIRRAL